MGARGPRRPGRAGHQEGEDTQGSLLAVKEATSVSRGEGTSLRVPRDSAVFSPTALEEEKPVSAAQRLSSLAVDALEPRRLPL